MKRFSVGTVALLIFGCLVALPMAAADRKSGDYYEIYSGEMTTFNYLVSSSENEHFMFANMIDGLVEYNRYGILVPSLAESWSSSPDGRTWTFKLRKGVKWLTNNKKEYAEVVAQDWVDAAKYLLTSSNASRTADIFYSVIKNAEPYFKGTLSDFSAVGVKAKDKYTLEYTLSQPVPYFLSMLTYVCFLPANGKFIAEQGTRFGTSNRTILYNGAYIMENYEPQASRELVRNAKYWDRDSVYIKRLIYRYNKEALALSPELFLRGETSLAPLPSGILDAWMKDPAKKAKLQPARTTAYTYFYALNFNPKFAAEYEPENWKIAVNDAAFRKSIFHALDRKAAMMTSEPYEPERRLNNTITPPYFVSAGGKDYVEMGGLAAFTATDSFDKGKAASYKAQAKKELAGKATFPVKIMMPYRGDMPEWANRVQVVEQQLESVLGTDYIDVIPVSYPATNFLGATRRSGNYAMEEVNWGPDYADPQTYTDPFAPGGTYNKPELATGYAGSGGKTIYENLVDAAKAETKDLNTRYELFAKAEAFLIGEAFVIPYAIGSLNSVSFQACTLEPFTSPFAPFGLSSLKYKGQVVLPKPLNTEEYKAREAEWKASRAEALKRAE